MAGFDLQRRRRGRRPGGEAQHAALGRVGRVGGGPEAVAAAGRQADRVHLTRRQVASIDALPADIGEQPVCGIRPCAAGPLDSDVQRAAASVRATAGDEGVVAQVGARTETQGVEAGTRNDVAQGAVGSCRDLAALRVEHAQTGAEQRPAGRGDLQHIACGQRQAIKIDISRRERAVPDPRVDDRAAARRQRQLLGLAEGVGRLGGGG